MLKELHLQNFKCFKDHTIPFKNLTVIVGKNNSGKTTILEALRLISIIITRKGLNFKRAPISLDLIENNIGVSPALNNFNIVTERIFHCYGKSPAIITATFENNVKIKIYIESNSVFAQLWDSNGNLLYKKSSVTNLDITDMNVLPQVMPLQKNERLLSSDYVHSHLSSDLMSRHFRNQLFKYKESFNHFKRVVAENWPGIKIGDLYNENNELYLQLKEGDFTAEISWMGDGIQLWIQAMWFLSRVDKNSIVILDEPDVYMHSELQKRLVKMLTNNYKQVILTTHSIKIMSLVNPQNILSIDRKKSNSNFVNSLNDIQGVVE